MNKDRGSQFDAFCVLHAHVHCYIWMHIFVLEMLPALLMGIQQLTILCLIRHLVHIAAYSAYASISTLTLTPTYTHTHAQHPAYWSVTMETEPDQ